MLVNFSAVFSRMAEGCAYVMGILEPDGEVRGIIKAFPSASTLALEKHEDPLIMRCHLALEQHAPKWFC